MKKLFALMLALVMILVATGAFAAKITINSTAGDVAQTDTTEYTYYKILDAEIENPTAITVDPDSGEFTEGDNVPRVSYYVTTQAKATALEETGLFTVTKDATADKWYVALKDDGTSGEAIATALNGKKAAFADASGTFAQTTPGGSVSKDGLAPGYYLITSTLGDVLSRRWLISQSTQRMIIPLWTRQFRKQINPRRSAIPLRIRLRWIFLNPPMTRSL